MRTRLVLLAATLLAGAAGLAIAQTEPTFDPNQLPALTGTVAEYSLTPRGDVDGLLLTDGTEVHTPPGLGTRLAAAVKPGDAVTIHGLKARALPLVQAASVSNDATHATVVDDGPSGPPHGRPPPDLQAAGAGTLTAEGRIKEQLHGPRGELNGALLEDGTIIHLPPGAVSRLSSLLAVGAPLFAQGDGYDGPLGHVVGARTIGPDSSQVVAIDPPPPPGGPDRAPPPPPDRP